MQKNVPVYTGKLAHYLLKRGYVIVDVAPKKDCLNETVFYFKPQDEIKEVIENYIAELNNN